MPESSEKDAAVEVEPDADRKRRQKLGRDKPGPARNVGDETPNPLPDYPGDYEGEGGGDAGRTS